MRRKTKYYGLFVGSAATLFAISILIILLKGAGSPGHPIVTLPEDQALLAIDVAIIVNDSDPLSRRIAEYYQGQRHIPHSNVIHVNFRTDNNTMSVVEFERIKSQVDNSTPDNVQVYVLTWLEPYRVSCMSITSAFTFGYDPKYCIQGCGKTRPSPYFNATGHKPYIDFGIRPTMVLAGRDFATVQQLIERGIVSDNSAPDGTAYLLDTNDKSRNVRSQFYAQAIRHIRNSISVQRIKGQTLRDKQDVLFYFTGLVRVPELAKNRFLPGAIGDHVTSTGGQLTDSKQMSIMEWIYAGATGSYGAVVEPCNRPEKFPHPTVVMERYVNGDTLIEAYWKSVYMPGQGIFVGEPLARPFGGYKLIYKADRRYVRIWSLEHGDYVLLGAVFEIGPYRELRRFQVDQSRGPQDIELSDDNESYFRITKVDTDRH